MQSSSIILFASTHFLALGFFLADGFLPAALVLVVRLIVCKVWLLNTQTYPAPFKKAMVKTPNFPVKTPNFFTLNNGMAQKKAVTNIPAMHHR
jgi:hypothetical protein